MIAAPPSRSADGLALDADPRKDARLLIGALGDRHALQADIEPGAVHHGEHRGEPAMGLADEPADGAPTIAEGQNAGGACVDAELVLEADAANVVARTETAVGLDQEFGHHEQRDAAAAWWRALDPRQHQMDDVGRPVVLAIGDEDFLAVSR